MDWYPVIILCTGIGIVISLILGLRMNAFLALTVAAIVVSLMMPGEWPEKITRVGAAFGRVAGAIGIVIALAAIIGWCLMESGSARRIVNSLTDALGEKRTPAALMSSGFVLSVPVFFDTVFYLVIPVIRSLWRKKRRNYVLYLTAVVAGGAVTHSMVPPTPGPLFMANELKIDLGSMILFGAAVGIPMSIAGLYVCRWLDRRNPIEMRPYPGEIIDAEDDEDDDSAKLPSLFVSLLPIVLPVILISTNTVAGALAENGKLAENSPILSFASVLGNPAVALLIAATISLMVVFRYRSMSLQELSEGAEKALTSAGLVILITAAGGAFGGMLKESGIRETFGALIGEAGSISTITTLLSAAAVASLMKFAQGSGTVAMMTTASLFAAMGFTGEVLAFHPAYLACAIGSGSLIGDWMNNSGFWIFSKMGVLTPGETLRTWTILTAALGLTGIVVTVVAATAMPLAG